MGVFTCICLVLCKNDKAISSSQISFPLIMKIALLTKESMKQSLFQTGLTGHEGDVEIVPVWKFLCANDFGIREAIRN